MPQREAIFLNSNHLQALLEPHATMAAIEAALRGLANGSAMLAPAIHLPLANGAVHVKAAGLAGPRPRIAVKMNVNLPDNPARGLPTIQGAVLLSDGEDGSLLAVLDSASLTAIRTAATTAVATQWLARAAARTALIVGCGAQCQPHAAALRAVRDFEVLYVHDRDPARATAAAALARELADWEVVVVSDLHSAARQSDVIVTCTTSRRAFLGPDDVAPGSFLAAVGADNADKQELSPSLLAGSKVVVDQLEQCAEIGELHHAIAAGAMRKSDVVAELGQLVAGAVRFAPSPSDIVIFDSTGTGLLDVAAASLAYELARAHNLGTRVQL